MTSPSGYVLVYDSAGEPVRKPVRGCACDQSASHSEFEVESANSGEYIPRRASQRPPLAAAAETQF